MSASATCFLIFGVNLKLHGVQKKSPRCS